MPSTLHELRKGPLKTYSFSPCIVPQSFSYQLQILTSLILPMNLEKPKSLLMLSFFNCVNILPFSVDFFLSLFQGLILSKTMYDTHSVFWLTFTPSPFLCLDFIFFQCFIFSWCKFKVCNYRSFFLLYNFIYFNCVIFHTYQIISFRSGNCVLKTCHFLAILLDLKKIP